MDTPPPIKSAELFNRGKDAKRRQRSKTQLSVSEFTLPKGGELSLVRDERFADLVRIKCPVGPEGMPPRKRRDVKGIKLDPRKAGRHMEVREIKGVVPEGSAVSHLPKEAERARVQDHLDIKPEDGKLIVDPKTGERLDKGGSIFGADDRYLFNDRAFPWRTTGLIRTAAGR